MLSWVRSCSWALMLAIFLLPLDAEAKKRFGGGGSFGKSFTTQKQVAPAPAPRQNTTQQSTSQQSAAQPGATATKPAAKPGMGGLMGGLLAGGLLGALFFGGAFEGIQLMDILLFGLIGFVLFKLFARGAAGRPQPSYAGHTPQQPEPVAAPAPAPAPTPAPSFEPTPLMSDRFSDSEVQLPAWFNREAFIDGARAHFTELQRAWNHNDLATIQSYCSAELHAELVREREQLGADALDNDLVSVMADIVGYSEADQEARLSINFYGWMREGAGNEATEFNEIWHLTRDLSAEGSDWFIAGIEQP